MKPFNVRVYGLWINENKEILLSSEFYKGVKMVKFPGGGLEYGEGLLDCLKREFMEETGLEINILRHYYTTDFFQESAFHTDIQLISIYYLVQPVEIKEIKGDGDPRNEGFRWQTIKDLTEEMVTFPIDKYVVNMILRAEKEKVWKQ